ncbi:MULTISPECIES: hypothetical protein [Mycobacterium avium complex (MAC)]|uniref:Uncharacterized protein n=1 Tax=Mycobacterium avium subsp. hominissuis TaxID=439334 RepID=A0AAI8SPU1_MYCAV|nr:MULTISPECIES: hypothetical protein [Mycobacterium avium complex (MAC)]ETB54993.1 hypothetical protein O981_06100 [Mycobacterium avium 10-5560]APT11925.1 hypothetical protein BS641_18135 [Mycobacterium avium subsp. hominissuis]ETZ47012.1 hypothetical protein L839_1113 [Mycobacterium avium MAV_120809_2495]ETZ56228.1 hypothetical protein L840_3987 [Mycobacterium sp. MAC_011194_8550]ETZ68124.1 hypothetical protein L841_2247 [Mycobacterium sp. MAC_080597_8934]
MSDPDAEDAELDAADRLEHFAPDDPTVRALGIETIAAAANQLCDAVDDAVFRGVPTRIINLVLDDLEDRLSVSLRSGDTVSLTELCKELDIEPG